jgi:Fic family protein
MPGLRGVSERGDWAGWLHYFLNGVARQAEDALSRAERISSLLARWRDKLGGRAGAKVAFRMVDMLGANPFVTPRGAERRLGMAYNTVMRAIAQLEKKGIVKEVSGAQRDRVFCAKQLLDILEEPALITPAEKF